MKIRIATILIFLLIVGTIGCKENTALEYENDPALYFENSYYTQQDSIAHTFFIQPDDQMRDTVFVEILTMGYPTDTDRPFVLEQTNAGKPGSAVAGKHFVAFNDPAIDRTSFQPDTSKRSASRKTSFVSTDTNNDLSLLNLRRTSSLFSGHPP